VEGRTRLALGGVATVAASIAVVCAVAMTTSVALADSAGAPAGAESVIVRAPAASAAASPSPVASPPPAPSQTPTDQPETVPAPEPEDISSPPIVQTQTGEPSVATEDQLVTDVQESGSWDAAYAWAEQRGWSSARTDAWITRLESKAAEKVRKNTGSDQLASNDSGAGNRTDSRLPAHAGTPSGRDHSGSTSGSKREQSRVPPG
jgi:hypothetical protein